MRRRDLLLSALVVPLLPYSAPRADAGEGLAGRPADPQPVGARTLRQLNLPELAKLGFVKDVISAFRSSPPMMLSSAFLLWLSNSSQRSPTSSLPWVQAPSGLLGRRPAPFPSSWPMEARTRSQQDGRRATRVQAATSQVSSSSARNWMESACTSCTTPSPRGGGLRCCFIAAPGTLPRIVPSRPVAEKAGIEIQSFYTAGPEEYEATFNAIRSSGADALLIASSAVFASDAARLAELGAESRVADHLRVARHGEEWLSHRLWGGSCRSPEACRRLCRPYPPWRASE